MNAKSEYLFLNGIEGTITGVEKTVGKVLKIRLNKILVKKDKKWHLRK